MLQAQEQIQGRFSKEFIADVMNTSDIAIVFDRDLKYSLINRAGYDQLKRSPEDLIGKSILDVYPEITASKNHRNLLRALEGEVINEIVEGRIKGEFFRSSYFPIQMNGNTAYVLVKALKLFMSKDAK